MIVKELIEELKKLDENAKVFFADFSDVTVVPKTINGKSFVFLTDELDEVYEDEDDEV